MFNGPAKRETNVFSNIGENKNFLKKVILAVLIIGIIVAGFVFGQRRVEDARQKITIDGLEFPKEEGEHSNLKFEFWYFAAHLEEEGNPENKFGVTLIFDKYPSHVKVNLVDGIQQKNFSSRIGIDQYDLLSEEKLAIKKESNFWLETEPLKYQINFSFENNNIKLDLDSIKPPLLRYNTADFFYYQQTRVKVKGQLSFSGTKYKVKGWGWIDHEGFQKSPYPSNWLWCAIQLDNNTEIIANGIHPYSQFNLLLIKDNNQIEQIKGDSHSMDDIDYWVDPETGYEYPVRFRLKIPAKNVDLEITTITDNQVIRGVEYRMYEGSCRITGSFDGQAVSGRAQLEVVPLR